MTIDQLIELHTAAKKEWLSLQAGPDWIRRNKVYDRMAWLSRAIDAKREGE